MRTPRILIDILQQSPEDWAHEGQTLAEYKRSLRDRLGEYCVVTGWEFLDLRCFKDNDFQATGELIMVTPSGDISMFLIYIKNFGGAWLAIATYGPITED